MARTPRIRTFVSSVSTACVAACTWLVAAPDALAAYRFDAAEAAFDATYGATPIDLTGVVVDEAGVPVAGASITAIGWGSSAANDGDLAITDEAGVFTLPALARRSVLLRVESDGYYVEIVPADLQRPLAESTADLGAVVLSQAQPGRARVMVGGDTMMGRRFVDVDQDGIEGEPGDLIRPATRADDAHLLFNFLRDVLSSADYTQLNLECSVTDDASTPHNNKTYMFFSYPETVTALPLAGVDAVSLGNNHMYDYLELGVANTLREVSNAGLDWFGAGMSETLALGSTLYRTLGGGVDVAFQGYSQLTKGSSSLPEYSIVASDGPPLVKGGALKLGDSQLNAFLLEDAPDRFAIPVVHGGTEYSDYPSSVMRSRFVQMVQRGAGVVVAHHPHTIHGIGLHDAGSGPRYIFMSLGNLMFDQDKFETFQSYLGVFDVDQTGTGAYNVHRVQLIPLHRDSYVPKLVSGDWLARTGRHIAHLSTMLPAAATPGAAPDGLSGAVVFSSGPRVVAVSSPSQYTTTDYVESLAAPLSAAGTGPVAYARLDPADSLAGVRTSAPASCDYGRDILLYGDFEDNSVDDSFHEGTVWPGSTSKYLQNSVVHGGAGAMVLLRKWNSTASTSFNTTNRMTFPAGRQFTLSGHVKGNNSGAFRVQVYWYTSGGTSISNSYVYTRASGTYDWQRFTVDLTPPSTAGSVRLWFRAELPASDEGETFVDDISLIAWEDTVADASAGAALATPNNWSFVRCAAANPALTSLDLSLTHRSYALAPATP
jgi:poly-gamma-glutamate capsule biosynthesis protein CapA/YwtB (metallophosphatase superfamily)